VKWSSSPRGLDLHHDLQRDLDDLARSGQRWAAEAQQGLFLYVSAAGFDDALRALGAGRADLRLLDLSDLYA
jgi:ABC-type amino acid transport substrate-binding protein